MTKTFEVWGLVPLESAQEQPQRRTQLGWSDKVAPGGYHSGPQKQVCRNHRRAPPFAAMYVTSSSC